jgi:hypothetical protein
LRAPARAGSSRRRRACSVPVLSLPSRYRPRRVAPARGRPGGRAGRRRVPRARDTEAAVHSLLALRMDATTTALTSEGAPSS